MQGTKMKPTEAARIIGCSPQQVRMLIRQGKLRARKVVTDIDCNRNELYTYQLSDSQVARYARQPQIRGYPRGVPRKPKGKVKTNNVKNKKRKDVL